MTDAQRAEQDETTQDQPERVEDLEVGDDAAEDVQGGNTPERRPRSAS